MLSSPGARVLFACIACAWTLAGTMIAPSSSRAQSGSEPSAEDRASAAEAFDRATRRYLAHEYAAAAEWFETAHRLVPTPAALVSAVRAHERAGDHLRAATLALRLEANYRDDESAARVAERALSRSHEFARVDVECEGPCRIELDGTLLDFPSFFVAPGETHRVRATFESGVSEQRVEGVRGAVIPLRISAPEPVAVVPIEPIAEPQPVLLQSDDAPQAPSWQTLSPIYALSAWGLTAVFGAILIWSAIDTLEGVPHYDADPTEARLADGQARELRTDVFIGMTAGLAAAAAVLSVFTDWSFASDSSARRERVAVGASAHGFGLAFRGAF